MFAGVADDLCRSVETHRLRIEEGAAEGCGEVAFQPARYVDEMREAGRVAFGKAVFAEAADLVEAALREIAIVAAPDHAFDHHVLQFIDHPAAAEGGHRLAQPVRLERGEFRRIERDLHRLFLEDRDPQSASENARQLVGRPVSRARRGDHHGLGSAPPLEIGMHHVALDRPGTHDRDLDHEVVEFARAQPRQHVHLRTALDLEHAQRIPLAQHRIGFGILARDRRQGQRAAVMLVDQVETFADAGQHAQREHIDLEDAQCLDIVLVPFDETAFGHRPIADRHGFGERPFGEDETADMLGQMSRHANHLLGQLENAAQVWIGHVHPRFRGVLLADLAPPAPPYGLGQRGGDILGQPHRLAHLADRHAWAIVYHRGAQSGAVAAIFAIDVLDHLLAPLMLEIDVDIGRLLAFFRDEAVEQQCVLGRVDIGDAKAIAHRRIGRAAASLAQDRRIDPAGVIDDILDREEIARQIELADQRQLAFERFAHAFGHAAGITPGGPLPCLRREKLLRVLSIGMDLLGIFIGQFVETEIAIVGQCTRCGDGMRPALEQPHHRFGRLEITFAIAMQQVTCRGDRGLVTDRGHHVLQRPPVRRGVVDVVGREDRQAVFARERIEPLDPRDVVLGVEESRRNMAQRGKLHDKMRQEFFERAGDVMRRCRRSARTILRLQFRLFARLARRKGDHIALHLHGKALIEIARWQQHQLHAFAMRSEHGEADVAGALFLPLAIERAHPPRGNQPA